jgi:hypothetical protein
MYVCIRKRLSAARKENSNTRKMLETEKRKGETETEDTEHSRVRDRMQRMQEAIKFQVPGCRQKQPCWSQPASQRHGSGRRHSSQVPASRARGQWQGWCDKADGSSVHQVLHKKCPWHELSEGSCGAPPIGGRCPVGRLPHCRLGTSVWGG